MTFIYEAVYTDVQAISERHGAACEVPRSFEGTIRCRVGALHHTIVSGPGCPEIYLRGRGDDET